FLKHITQHDVKLKDEHKSAFEWNHEEKRRALPPVDENIEVVKSKTVPQSLTNSKINFRYASEFSNSLKSSRVWRNARASKTTEMDDASKDWYFICFAFFSCVSNVAFGLQDRLRKVKTRKDARQGGPSTAG